LSRTSTEEGLNELNSVDKNVNSQSDNFLSDKFPVVDSHHYKLEDI